jgi:hypothetical protein
LPNEFQPRPTPTPTTHTESSDSAGNIDISYNVDSTDLNRPFSRTHSVIGGGSSNLFQASVIAAEIANIEKQLASGRSGQSETSGVLSEFDDAQSVHDLFANILRMACKLKRRIVTLLDRMLAPKYVFTVSGFVHCSADKYADMDTIHVYSEGRVILWRSGIDMCLDTCNRLVDLIERMAIRMKDFHIYLERKPVIRPRKE